MIRAIYHLTCPPEQADVLARDIALEQTVEVPEAMVTDPEIREQIIGKVLSVEPLAGEPEKFRAIIGFNADLTAGQLPQLLNLLYGNISIKKGIRLADAELPLSLLSRFVGPRFGIEGIRAELGVYGRPLLSSALKPRGSSHDTFAQLAHDFALGGGDLIKDDHNLVDASFENFQKRVALCHEAVQNANAQTKRRALYLPNIMHRVDEIDRHLDYLVSIGVRGILISPMVLGLDTVRRIAAKYPFIIMAHPAFSGTYYTDPDNGIDAGLLLGKFFRLAGCDASVFPNHGGRFSLPREACDGIARGMRDPLGLIRPGFPVPAGGMKYDRLGEMAAGYGPDTIFLIGGGLLTHSNDLAASTREFLDTMRHHFKERLAPPAPNTFISSCEIPRLDTTAKLHSRDLLPFKDFIWEGREPAEYKPDQSLPFQGVSRHELIGPKEETAFDLRYFEVEPGGFTSFEKHQHTHTIICIRGEGQLLRGDKMQTLRNLDIAYVGPMEAHQLKNEAQEPFGFFCIVDRERDKPVAV